MTTIATLAAELGLPVEAIIEHAACTADLHDTDRVVDAGGWDEWRPEVTDWAGEVLAVDHADAVRRIAR